VPPLQSVFDMPSPNLSLSKQEDEQDKESDKESDKDSNKDSNNDPVVEGMKSIGDIKTQVKTLWNSIKSFRTLIKNGGADIFTKSYESFYEWTWTPVLNILPVNTPIKIVERDTEFILTIIILFHVLLIIIFAAYNWYYILFDKEGNSQPAWIFKNLNDCENSYIFQPFYVLSRPGTYIDHFCTVQVKKMSLDFIPETCKLYMIIFLLFAACITLFEEYKNYKATIGFPILITILIWFEIVSQILSSKQDAWVMFLFLISSVALVIVIIGIITGIASTIFDVIGHKLIIYVIIWGFFAAWAVKFFMGNPPISIFIVLFSIIAIGIIGVITYYTLPLAFFVIYGYLIGQSLFGFTRFEGKNISSYSGYAKKMLDKDVSNLTGIPLLLVKVISGIPLLLSMILFFLGVAIYIPFMFEDWSKDRCMMIIFVTCIISAVFCGTWAVTIKLREFANLVTS
jgi:hypothetical protein